MLSSANLKRSVAALGVVAGLLAAAVPASAQLPATTVGVFKGEVIGLEPNALGTLVGSEGVKVPAKTLPTWTEGNNQPSGDYLRGEAIDIIP